MKKPLATLALTVSLALFPALAGAADVAVGVRVGTAGLGPEVAFALNPYLDARIPVGWYDYDSDFDKTGVRYDATLELRNALLLLDWHPFGSSFRLSAGGGWNDNRLQVSAPISELVRRYRPDIAPLIPASAGTIRGEAKGSSFAPYVGLGAGHPFAGGRWGVSFDLGVIYQGEPEVDLTNDLNVGVPIPPNARAIIDLATADEERRLEKELEDYRYYPVVALGISFRL